MPFTRQQVLDRVREVFVVNKAPRSYREIGNTGCVYDHSISGFGCAIGCLIPQEVALDWDSLVSGAGVRGVIEKRPSSFAKYFSIEDLDFLVCIQHAHDEMLDEKDNIEPGIGSKRFPEYMDRCTRIIASRFNLTINN